MSKIVKLGIVKNGCIGIMPLLEFFVDERADRSDIDVLVIGSGAKLGLQQCKTVVSLMISQKPDLVLLIGPAQLAAGPSEGRRMLNEAMIPTIIISDAPAKKIIKELENSGLGYIIINADSMIGARREFLDPVEMALFNADVLKVLASTGAIRVVVKAIDDVISSLKEKTKIKLPRIVIDKEMAVEAAGFNNPYAKAKAMAAYEISKAVANINFAACFKVKEWTRYVHMVSSGHEMMRVAASLADEAREFEKSGDSILRTPHYVNGKIGVKRALIKKPKKAD